jgi:hypothetical protein
MQVEEAAKACVCHDLRKTSVLTIILQVYKFASDYIVSEYDDKRLTLLGLCKNDGKNI